MPLLTVNDLKPGHLYRVIDVGDFADKAFQGAIVLGANEACDYKGVTLVPDPAAGHPQSRVVGALWGVTHAATEITGASTTPSNSMNWMELAKACSPVDQAQ